MLTKKEFTNKFYKDIGVVISPQITQTILEIAYDNYKIGYSDAQYEATSYLKQLINSLEV